MTFLKILQYNTAMNIKDKVVIITGVSHGIGLATAKLFAEKVAQAILETVETGKAEQSLIPKRA